MAKTKRLRLFGPIITIAEGYPLEGEFNVFN